MFSGSFWEKQKPKPVRIPWTHTRDSQVHPPPPTPLKVRAIPGPVSGFVPMDLNLYGWQVAQSMKPWTLRHF